MSKQHILFLCTGNSCRSQMAEGWAKTIGNEKWQVKSAGLEAHGKNPRAIAVMKEAGIDISAQESTRLTQAMIDWADLIITVCSHADEHCPAISGNTKKRHLPFDDPAKASGSEEEIMAEFRRVRDEIKTTIEALIKEQITTE